MAGAEKSSFGVVSVRKDQSRLVRKQMGENGILRSIGQIMTLSYFGVWSFFWLMNCI